jgi:DsbC/DsbD-like thiol-disulfide interchange protein
LTKRSLLAAILIAALAHLGAGSSAVGGSTGWVDGHNSKIRLLFGGRPGRNGDIERYAGLEIHLAPDWKTYWRQPGSAGGIPPAIDWSGSTNLEALDLRFPAPERFVDSTGDTIGYKKSVVFPLALKLQDPNQPLTLDLKIFFGVCREICIPAEATFRETVSPHDFSRWPPKLAAATSDVPRRQKAEASAGGNLPRVQRIVPLARSDGQRALIIDVQFPGGSDGADLFAERGDGLGLAMTERVTTPSPGLIRFRLPIADAAEWDKLGETGLRLTMVSKRGASTVERPRP